MFTITAHARQLRFAPPSQKVKLRWWYDEAVVSPIKFRFDEQVRLSGPLDVRPAAFRFLQLP